MFITNDSFLRSNSQKRVTVMNEPFQHSTETLLNDSNTAMNEWMTWLNESNSNPCPRCQSFNEICGVTQNLITPVYSTNQQRGMPRRKLETDRSSSSVYLLLLCLFIFFVWKTPFNDRVNEHWMVRYGVALIHSEWRDLPRFLNNERWAHTLVLLKQMHSFLAKRTKNVNFIGYPFFKSSVRMKPASLLRCVYALLMPQLGIISNFFLHL